MSQVQPQNNSCDYLKRTAPDEEEVIQPELPGPPAQPVRFKRWKRIKSNASSLSLFGRAVAIIALELVSSAATTCFKFLHPFSWARKAEIGPGDSLDC